LTFVLLLASLGLVVWRQGRALESMKALEDLRQERAIAEAQRMELVQRIQRLESRAWVVASAQAKLGLRVPTGREIVLLPVGGAVGGATGRSAR